MPEATHMLAAALLNYADDDGYFNANPALVKAACSPLREPSVSIHESLIALQKCSFLTLGVGKDGRRYAHISSFSKHQKINRASPSKIKGYNIDWEQSLSTHGVFSEDSLQIAPGTGNREQGTGNGTGNGSPRDCDGTSVAFQMAWSSYPARSRTAKPISAQAWLDALDILESRFDRRRDAEDWLLRRVKDYAAAPVARSKFCKSLANWLGEGRYDDPPEAWERGDDTSPATIPPPSSPPPPPRKIPKADFTKDPYAQA